MRKMRLTAMLVLILLFAGCHAVPAETTGPETTVPVTTVPETTVPQTTAPETTAPEITVPETTVSRDALRVGYYVLEEASFKGEPLTEDVMEIFQAYIQIREGHVGSMYFNTTVNHLDWTNRFLIINGAYNPYTIEDDVITLTYDWDYIFALRYCGNILPENYALSPLEPGLYLLHSVDISGVRLEIIEEPGVDKGYVLLRQDGTGLFFNGRETQTLDWSSGAVQIKSLLCPHVFLGPEETGGEAILVLQVQGYVGYYLRENGDEYEDFNPEGADV